MRDVIDYLIDAEVGGGFGDGTVLDNSVWPPRVTALEQLEELNPQLELPEWRWMHVIGTAGDDDAWAGYLAVLERGQRRVQRD